MTLENIQELCYRKAISSKHKKKQKQKHVRSALPQEFHILDCADH
jgi:hypothetical protein